MTAHEIRSILARGAKGLGPVGVTLGTFASQATDQELLRIAGLIRGDSATDADWWAPKTEDDLDRLNDERERVLDQILDYRERTGL